VSFDIGTMIFIIYMGYATWIFKPVSVSYDVKVLIEKYRMA